MAFDVADDLAHVCVVVVGQVGLLRLQDLDDAPSAVVSRRLSPPPDDFWPTAFDSSVSSHLSSSDAVMFTASLKSS